MFRAVRDASAQLSGHPRSRNTSVGRIRVSLVANRHRWVEIPTLVVRASRASAIQRLSKAIRVVHASFEGDHIFRVVELGVSLRKAEETVSRRRGNLRHPRTVVPYPGRYGAALGRSLPSAQAALANVARSARCA